MAPLIIPIGLTNQKKLDFIKQTHVTTTWYLLHTTLSSWTSVCNRGAAQISVVTASLIPSSQYLSKTLNTNKQSMMVNLQSWSKILIHKGYVLLLTQV